MTNPVLAEVTRGGHVESAHRGAVAVFDADGGRVLALGDIEQPVFPRSAVKSIQALPLVESGAADAFGLTDEDLALACASHAGEPRHAERAAGMLAKAGLGLLALECGTHWPSNHDATIDLARSGARPTALHNNCSGKHSGFLCACRHLGLEHSGYVRFDHGYQRLIAQTMTEVTGAAHGEDNAGVDGCSIPTYRIPLSALARGFARMGTGLGLDPIRAAAARRLFKACMDHPFYVQGTGGQDTLMLEAGAGRVFVKHGAEAVVCGAIPELGLGFAIKVDDGYVRALQPIAGTLVARLLKDDAAMAEAFGALAQMPIPTRNGFVAGEVRATTALS